MLTYAPPTPAGVVAHVRHRRGARAQPATRQGGDRRGCAGRAGRHGAARERRGASAHRYIYIYICVCVCVCVCMCVYTYIYVFM